MVWNPEDLETIPCDFCGTSSIRNVYTRPDGLNIAECNRCKLCFVCPRPKAHLIHNLYCRDYFNKDSVQPNLGYSDYESDKNRAAMMTLAEKRLDVLMKILNGNVKLKRCLEVGCATGEFCYFLTQKGIATVGCDVSDFAINVSRERYPLLDFRVGKIEDLAGNERFDGIFAFEVIEHVLSPKAFLQQARQHLNDGGILVISTPNYQCGKVVGFDRWLGFSMSFEHLYFFTPTVLIRYANEQRLSVVDWFTGGGSGVSPEQYKRQPIVRTLAKGIFSKMGLLEFARQTKSKLIRRSHGYQRHGNLHTLYIVFRAY